MRWLWWAAMFLAVLVLLLGGLWLGQGIGLIRIEPVACVGACEPVEAPSLTWSLAGIGLLALGMTGLLVARRRLSQTSMRKRADRPD